jgi:hypothetical protein
VLRENGRDADGDAETSTASTWDGEDLVETAFDSDANGEPSSVTTLEYDGEHRLVRWERSNDGRSAPEQRTTARPT